MGLDGVEIAMELEERFQIAIDDEEIIYIHTTPGRIEWFVREKIAGRQPAVVDYEGIMRQIERALAALPTHRSGWFRTWNFQKLFPVDRRAEFWSSVGITLGVELPDFSEFQDYGFGAGGFPLAIRIVDQNPEWAPLKRAGTSVAPLPSNAWLDPELGHQIRDIIADALDLDPAVVTPSSLMVADHRVG